MFSPEFREMAPVKASDPTSDPDVIVYARLGSASPKVFTVFVAVTVIGRGSMVRLAATKVIA